MAETAQMIIQLFVPAEAVFHYTNAAHQRPEREAQRAAYVALRGRDSSL